MRQHDILENTLGQFRKSLGKPLTHKKGLGSVLQHHRIAGHQSGDDGINRGKVRIIPRGHREHHTQRLALDEAGKAGDGLWHHIFQSLARNGNHVACAFFNSGQSCCGIERIYVHKKLYKDFVDGFVDLTRKYVLDDPLLEKTTLGPLVKPEAAEFVRKQIRSAVRAGASAHIDEKQFPVSQKGSSYLAPQVLTGVNHQMSVMTEESFGPVVGIMKVSDDDEALALMNDSEYGLTAAIWTQDEGACLRMGDEIATGTVFMNRCDYLDPALTWTGVKNTGRGATLSRVGYETLTRPKSYHLRTKTS